MAQRIDETMYQYIERRASLAYTYAEDGAYESAARILEELSADVRAHADYISSTMERITNV